MSCLVLCPKNVMKFKHQQARNLPVYPLNKGFNRDTLQRSQNLKSFTIYTINKYKKKGLYPKEVNNLMIFTPISHLRGMLYHSSGISWMPMHTSLSACSQMRMTVSVILRQSQQ